MLIHFHIELKDYAMIFFRDHMHIYQKNKLCFQLCVQVGVNLDMLDEGRTLVKEKKSESHGTDTR